MHPLLMKGTTVTGILLVYSFNNTLDNIHIGYEGVDGVCWKAEEKFNDLN